MPLQTFFAAQCLQTALLGSLLSVAVLVALFFYLNRYTQRNYFTIWATAWMFYGLWLVIKLTVPEGDLNSFSSFAKLLCIETSAVFLLWGGFRYLNLQTPQTLMGLFLGFLYVWSFVAPHFFDNILHVEVPCFSLIGAGSIMAGVSFVAFSEHRRFVGANLLTVGFLIWGIYLVAYPFLQQTQNSIGTAFFFSAAVQLFIAVSMIILVLEEVRYNNDSIVDEIETVKAEREKLKAKIQTSEQEMRTLYGDAHLKEQLQSAYEELRATHKAVVEQERLSVLGQIASGMAHDINNALTPLIGFSELLIENGPNLPDGLHEPLSFIRKSGKDIERIVGRVRQFYRRRSNEEPFSRLDLNILLREAVSNIWPTGAGTPALKSFVDINLQLEENLPEINGSADELREVFRQLLSNAVDAMPEGGAIQIRTALVAQGPAFDSVSGRRVMVEVRDQGKGMDAATRQRCIEPFFTTKGPRFSGLGLSLVYGAMQRHDGTLEIESDVNQGTRIILRFLPGEQQPRKNELLDLPPVSATLRLLCVDDEPLVLKLLKDVLEMYGHNVQVASSGSAGIQAFKEAMHQEMAFQVVITDLGMPDVDGCKVVNAIKELSPATPVILLTGWGSFLDQNEEVLQRVDAVLKKPLSMAQLEAVLRRIGRSLGNHSLSVAESRMDQPEQAAKIIGV
jgi:signal transduction histidine kinase/FixJ family two-component response regulator